MAMNTNGPVPACLAGNPFMGLGDGHDAPILNYNLPQKTCYDVNSFFPVSVPTKYFKPQFSKPPTPNPWGIAARMSLEEITSTLKSDIMGSKAPVLLQNAKILAKRKDLIRFLAESGIKHIVQDPKPEVYIAGDSNLRVAPLAGTGNVEAHTANNQGRPIGGTPRINHLTAIPTLPAERIQVAGYTLAYIATQVADGLIPELVTVFGGKVVMQFHAMPAFKPRIMIVEHSKMCSFLGDYGAGKTVKTFSLLPGERTSITVKTYKDKTSSFTKSSSTTTNEYTSSYYADDASSQSEQSENILDSYSQHSADQVQNMLEQLAESSTGDGSQATSGRDTNMGGGVQGGLNLFGMLNWQASGGGQVNVSHGNSSNSYRDNHMSNLASVLSTHVNESSQHRDVDVNTSTGNASNHSTGGSAGANTTMSVAQQESMMIKAGEEAVTVRELQNINFSRVLNFVFRQLMQEYITVTWLNDASIVFTTGYPGQQRAVRLSELETFLTELIDTPAHRDEVRKAIMLHFCNVANYQGTIMPFAEKVTEVFQDCVDATTVPAIIYWRKRRALSDSYTSGGLNITVPGIITSVQRHILRTDSVIVDALLGQGEALDCYNMRLQEEAARAALLRNDRYAQETSLESDKILAALAAIAAITDPVVQADAYKKMFGDCCDIDSLKLGIHGCGCDPSSGSVAGLGNTVSPPIRP
jgi:hypothetical protein